MLNEIVLTVKRMSSKNSVYFTRFEFHLSADRICVHHLFHAWRGKRLTFLLVRFKNCFSDPQDIYSVMNITWKIIQTGSFIIRMGSRTDSYL